MSLQNVDKPEEECSFLRSYRVGVCSFTTNKTPLQVLFEFAKRLVVSQGETRCLTFMTDFANII